MGAPTPYVGSIPVAVVAPKADMSPLRPSGIRTGFGIKGFADILTTKIYHQFWFPYSELTCPVVVLRRLGPERIAPGPAPTNHGKCVLLPLLSP